MPEKDKNTRLHNGTEEIVLKVLSKYLIQKFGLQRYTRESGITVITIMYNADTEEGWLSSIAMPSTLKDRQDNPN